MSQPPQDALDLYAFGVEWCEERGIPLGHIRVRWVESKDSFWYYGLGFYAGLRWYQSKTTAEKYDPTKLPFSFFLDFPSADDALCYGLTGVVPWDDHETCLVWVNPGHEFRLVAYKEKGIRVSCRACCHNDTFHFKTSAEYSDAVKDPSVLMQPPPHIQLPACIKRHQLESILTWDDVSSQGEYTRMQASCDACKKRFDLPNDKIQLYEVRGIWKYTIDPSWVKSLGRCPGAP